MVNNIEYTSIKEIASELMRHPLMLDITLEAIIQYTTKFIGIVGLPNVYYDKIEVLDICNYRASLPCDLVYINQVKDTKNNIAIRHSTDTFYLDNSEKEYIKKRQEYTFKTQGNVIYTSFKDGQITVAYKAIPLDCDGLPMIPSNSIFLEALELFIKLKWFTIQFDMGKISPAVLQNIQQEYAWRVGQLNTEFTIPSISEMEAISNIFNQILPRINEFKKGFKSLGNREYLKDQR